MNDRIIKRCFSKSSAYPGDLTAFYNGDYITVNDHYPCIVDSDVELFLCVGRTRVNYVYDKLWLLMDSCMGYVLIRVEKTR